MSKSSLLKSGAMMSIGLLLGRLVGMLREVFIAKEFGVTELADISVLALTFPDLIIALFISGAASIVLIPRFQEIDEEKQFSYYVSISLVVFLIFLIVSCLLFLNLEYVVYLLAPKLNAAAKLATIDVLQWVLLCLPIAAMTAVSRAFLQAQSRFFTTSFENLINNLCILLGLIVFVPQISIMGVVVGILLGAFFRWFLQLVNILYCSKVNLVKLKIKEILDKKIIYSFLQALSGGTVLMLLPIVARSFGSASGEGAIAVFNYSYRIVELPFSVAISVFSIVVFPQLVRTLNTKDEKKIGLFLKKSVRFLLLISIPLSTHLIWLLSRTRTLKESVFNIPLETLLEVGIISQIGLLLLPFRGISLFVFNMFGAKKDTKTPMIVQFIVLLASLIMCYGLSLKYGLLGAVVGLNIAYLLAFLLEQYLLVTKLRINLFKYIFNGRSLVLLLSSLLIVGLCETVANIFQLSLWGTLFLSISSGLMILFYFFWQNKEDFKSLRG